jgi:hypothetical protein
MIRSRIDFPQDNNPVAVLCHEAYIVLPESCQASAMSLTGTGCSYSDCDSSIFTQRRPVPPLTRIWQANFIGLAHFRHLVGRHDQDHGNNTRGRRAHSDGEA